MARYYANMYVNNGTQYRPDWEGTNKNKLAEEISAAARGNCFAGNHYSWQVWNEQGIIVAAGAGYKKQNGNIRFLNCEYLIGDHI